MLKRLHLRNFTAFEEADFEFGPGLNVIVGANGTGKSHVLKAGYVSEEARINVDRTAAVVGPAFTGLGASLAWSASLFNLLREVFLINKVGYLIRRNTEEKAEIQVGFGTTEKESLSFQIIPRDESTGRETSSLKVDERIPLTHSAKELGSVFIPAKEVLTLGWLPSLYNRREIPIDKTYPDVITLLMGPVLRQPEPAHIVAQLQQLIGGKVEEEGGHFYLSAPEQPRMEMNLVAEGVRKFATLYKLLANGTLTPETTLFWDEPEANLNPALLKEMAAVLTELAKAGFQIILATHSLFLLKELHILARQEHKPVRYFGLSAQPGEATTVATADNLELLPNIVALDAELDQSDRFQRVLDQEDANGN